MVRTLYSEEQREYNELKRFLMTLATFRDKQLGSPVSMVASFEGVFAGVRRGRVVPLSALRQAAHDMVAWSRHLPESIVRDADAYLKGRGSVTLTMMAHRLDGVVPKLLKRGRIRTDEEFYIITEPLSDVSSQGLKGDARLKAERMVGVYESKSRKA